MNRLAGKGFGGYARAMRKRLPYWCCLAGLLAASAPDPAWADERADGEPDLAGLYDGSMVDLAAFLLLEDGGRFRFALTTGALDLDSAGQWHREGDCAVLQSDPYEQPRFELSAEEPLPAGQLEIRLAIEGGGNPQYFDYFLTLPDGTIEDGQMREDGVHFEFTPGEGPDTAMIVLPIYDLRSAQVPLPPGGGRRLTFRFEPNDLGFYEFGGVRACLDGDGLEVPILGDRLTMREVERDAGE